MIIFDDMIADMLSNKKFNPVVTELFIRGRKLNISLVFITQSYFAVPKNIRLNSTHYFVIEIPKKSELQQVTFNHSSDIDFQDFMNLYKKCTAKPCSFLVIETCLASDNYSRFRKNLFQTIWKLIMIIDCKISTALKLSKYGAFHGPYFPAFSLNTEIYEVNLRIQSK